MIPTLVLKGKLDLPGFSLDFYYKTRTIFPFQSHNLLQTFPCSFLSVPRVILVSFSFLLKRYFKFWLRLNAKDMNLTRYCKNGLSSRDIRRARLNRDSVRIRH